MASMIDSIGYEKTKMIVSGWVNNLATEVFSSDTQVLKAKLNSRTKSNVTQGPGLI